MFEHPFSTFFHNFLVLFIEMSFYIFLGLLFVGILHAFIPSSWITKHIGKKGFLSTLKASLFGVPLPLCSCGVIPFIVYLKKSKASTGAIFSFLISTPQTGIDSIIATYGLLGPIFAIFRPIAAFLSGIIGGFAIEKYENAFLATPFENLSPILPKKQDSCPHCQEVLEKQSHSISSILKTILTYGFRDMVSDISVSFLVGVFLAALITTVIPADFFAGSFLGSGIWAMLLTILIGLPMYICSTSSIPIAISLLLIGISPGAAFVFLFVGPATNVASIAMLTKTVGKKLVSLYLLILILEALLMGTILDTLFSHFQWNLTFLTNEHSMMAQTPLHITVAILFSIVLLGNMLRKAFKK